MAQDTAQPSSDHISGYDLCSLVESIKDMTRRRMVLYSEYKTKSPFNPTGNKKRKLTRTLFQNGQRVNIKTMFDDEIKLANTVAPGRYINKLVTVRLVEGSNGSMDQIHVEYANRSNDQRIENANHWRSFLELLRLCHEEMKAAKA